MLDFEYLGQFWVSATSIANNDAWKDTSVLQMSTLSNGAVAFEMEVDVFPWYPSHKKKPNTKNWEYSQWLLSALSTCPTFLHVDLHLFVCKVIGPPMSISLFYMYNSIFSLIYPNQGYYQPLYCLSIYLVSSQLVQNPLPDTLLHYWSKACQSDTSKRFWPSYHYTRA